MTESLKTSMLKLALSKGTWRQKLLYHAKALLFYPLLYVDERNATSNNGRHSSNGVEGDDVYPLF